MQEDKKLIDIVVPCYNEEAVLGLLFTALNEVFEKARQQFSGRYSFNVILVNDGSSDNTLTEMKKLAERADNYQYLSFSRNFGKEAAIYAGLKASRGDYLVLMDADLQHPPQMILDFIRAAEEGYDSCVARRRGRHGEKAFREPFSNIFFDLNNKLSSVKLEKGEVDYRIVSKRVVEAVLSLSEKERFSKGLFAWAGFKTKWLEYESGDRAAGQTKWSLTKLIRYAFSGLTAFSTAPLRFVTATGCVITLVAFIYIVIILIKTLILGVDTPGYASTLCIVLFLGGIIELSVGILGAYIGRIYLESKDRPMYVLDETNIKEKF